jgi:hypothetical protein
MDAGHLGVRLAGEKAKISALISLSFAFRTLVQFVGAANVSNW